tara:strand:+ start:2279 stop:3472 length:1194 start_codon:yes stop_codon:yes gene_type:complete
MKETEVNHTDRAHSNLGASSASRWLACPSSVNLSEGIEDQSSSFATLGTCAHEVCDMALTQGKDASHFIGNTYEGHVVTKEMADHCQLYVDYVTKQAEGKELSVEERVNLHFIDPRMFGSNDAIIYEPHGTLEVIDFKYGAGIEVLPENNKQLMYYALGASHGGEYTHVKMTIVQPRIDNPIKSWTVPFKVIADYAEELRRGVERVDSGVDLYEVGEHCRFCKAKAVCPQNKRNAQELARVDFADHITVKEESFPIPSTLSNAELSKVLEHAKNIKDWLKAVEVHALNELELGREIEGYKLVAGRSIRKLTNPVEFETEFGAIYGDDIYTPKKLKGTGELEKLIGKKEVAPFFTKPPASNTFAPIADKRKEVIPQVKEEFAEYINQPEIVDFKTMEF